MDKRTVQTELDWLYETDSERIKLLGSAYEPLEGWVDQKVARAYRADRLNKAKQRSVQPSEDEARLEEMEVAQDAKIAKLEAEGKTLVGTEHENQRQRKRRATRLAADTVTPSDEVSKAFTDGSPILLTRYDDNAIAEAFIAAHPRLVWNSTRQVWMSYNGSIGIWEELANEAAYKRIDGFLQRLQTDADTDEDAEKLAARCGFQATQGAVASKIATKNHVVQEQFDADPYRRVFGNGVFDPREPEQGVLPFDPDLYATLRVPVNYNPRAAHPRFADILMPLPDDSHEWMQLMAGQSLLGFQPAGEFAIFLHGMTASNGKSLWVDAMEATAGGYSGRPSESTVLAGESYDMVSFEGLTQAIIEELPERMLPSAPLKRLIGTDSFKGRQIREKHRIIKNRATLWITQNVPSTFDTTDSGIKRRLRSVPFTKKFVDTEHELADWPVGTAFLKKADLKGLVKHDSALQEAILAWRVEGAIRWCATPPAQRAELEASSPESVNRSTDRWLKKEDTIHGWIMDRIVFDPQRDEEGTRIKPENFCLSTDLYQSYSAWMKANGHTFTVKNSTFLDRLALNAEIRERGLEVTRGRVGKLMHSPFEAADGSRQRAGTTPVHMKGLRFRTELDDYDRVPNSPASLIEANEADDLEDLYA